MCKKNLQKVGKGREIVAQRKGIIRQSIFQGRGGGTRFLIGRRRRRSQLGKRRVEVVRGAVATAIAVVGHHGRVRRSLVENAEIRLFERSLEAWHAVVVVVV